MNKETKSYLHGAYNVVGEGATDGKKTSQIQRENKAGKGDGMGVGVYAHSILGKLAIKGL